MYQLQKEKNINIIFYATMTVGVVFSILHLMEFLFDMIVSVAFYSKVNIPSIAYIICHFLVLFIPLLMIIPNGKIPKAMILKWVFYGIGICYLLGCSWIIYFIVDNSFAALFTSSAEQLQSYQRELALSFNYMTWECYTPLNILFSLIQAFFFFILGASLEEGKAVFTLVLPISTLLSAVVPILYILITPGNVGDALSSAVLRHVFILGSQIFASGGLFAISISNYQWEHFLWTFSDKK